MRIAFFVPSFPELSETFIIRQVTGLIDRGHEIRIFAYREASEGPVHETVERYALRSLVRPLPHRDDVRTSAERGSRRGIGALISPPAAAAALGSLRREHAHAMGGWLTLMRTLAALGSEKPFDVVHCHYGEIGLRYRVAARWWGAPLVVSFYGHDCSSYPIAHGRRVFEPLFAVTGAVTCLGAHMRARLLELGCPEHVLRTVPLAVDPESCAPAVRRPKAPGTPVRLLTVARLTEKKGIEFALRAVALVVEEFPHVEYHVIGTGTLRTELEALAESLGVAKVVRFLGARTGASVVQAMREADLFLLPSVTAANGDQEGTPTVILEASCSGLPVLATRHAGIPEIVRDGESGILVPERDVTALAEGLRTLLRQPERWPAMGDAGRRLVESAHATATVAAQLEQVYEELRSPAR